jgi:hypothetical protein
MGQMLSSDPTASVIPTKLDTFGAKAVIVTCNIRIL